MRSQPATIEFVSFSTRGLPPRGRGDALRNLQERGIMTVEPLRDHSPHAAIRKRFLPGADILSGTLGGLRQFGTPNGGDNVFLSMILDGDSIACERGREIALHRGEALVFSGEGGCTINRPAPAIRRYAHTVSGAGSPCRQSQRHCDATDTEGNRLPSAACQLSPRYRHGACPGFAGPLPYGCVAYP